MKFLRLRPGDDITATNYEIDDLIDQLEEMEAASEERKDDLRKALPDVVAVVSTVPSEFVETLVDTADYDLVPIHFARAFAQIPVDEEDFDRDHVDQIRTAAVDIPAYAYGGADPTPEIDCPTMASPLIIVTHRNVPNEVVSRLLEAIHTGAIARLYRPPPLSRGRHPLSPGIRPLRPIGTRTSRWCAPTSRNCSARSLPDSAL